MREVKYEMDLKLQNATLRGGGGQTKYKCNDRNVTVSLFSIWTQNS